MYWLALAGLVVFFCVYEFTIKPSPLKTGYVDVNKLYSEFQLSKELDMKIKTVQTARKNILDSLALTITAYEQQFTDKTPSAEEQKACEIMQREYGLKQQQFVQDNEQLTQEYQAQIFSQLNQFVQDYSKEKGYDYIFGANGSGALMATNDNKDLTTILIKYVNNRYAGK